MSVAVIWVQCVSPSGCYEFLQQGVPGDRGRESVDGLGLVLDLVSPAGLVLRAGADLRGGHAVLAKVLRNQRQTGRPRQIGQCKECIVPRV